MSALQHRGRPTNDRLALLIPDLSGGGAQRSMVTLANAFSAAGQRVDLLAVRPSGPLRRDVSSAVNVVSLDRWWTHFPGIGTNKRRRVLTSLPAIVAYLRRERPRVLMPTSHSACVAGMLALQLARVPTRGVLRIDSYLSRSPAMARTRSQRRRMRRARRLFTKADTLIGISTGVAENARDVLQLDRERVVSIPNPTVTSLLREKARAPLEHPWFAPGSPQVILGVGRLVRQKDFETLVRAFRRVRSERAARLLILGDGKERHTIEALVRTLGVAEDVSLPGYVENALPYMARAAVFVLSSAWEGFGNVLVEAMACGTPVVSTDCPSGPAEILEGGRYGPLVPVGDDDALARAIVSTLDRPPDRGDLRARAEEFSDELIGQRYLEVLLR